MGYWRQLLFVTLFAGLALGAYLFYEAATGAPAEPLAQSAQNAPRVVTVEVAPAETRRLEVVLEAVGTTRALRSVDIVPHAEGRITEIEIAAGREVEAGTVLARLDDEIEQATLAETRATLQEKTRALERSEALLRNNNVSQAAIDLVRSEVAIARANLDRARRRLDDRVVRAPFSGVLGITSVDLGARVDTSTVLTSLDDLSAVEIEFRLPETVYGQIDEGKAVSATSAAFPGRSFTGSVAAVDSRIDQTSRAFKVRARLPNDRRELPAGMFMRLSLGLEERDAVVVTEEAILVQGRDAYLFVLEEGRAVRRLVATGLRRDGMVEVETGVAAGEPVISRGIQSLRDGIAVEVLNAPVPVPGADSPEAETVPPATSEGTSTGDGPAVERSRS